MISVMEQCCTTLLKPHSNSRRFWLVRQSAQQTVSEMGVTFNEEKWSKEARSEVRGRERFFFCFVFFYKTTHRERNASAKRRFRGLFVQEVVSYNKAYTLLPGEMWFCTKEIFIPKDIRHNKQTEVKPKCFKVKRKFDFSLFTFCEKNISHIEKMFPFFQKNILNRTHL